MPALLTTAAARRRTRVLWIAAPFLLWLLASMLLALAPHLFARSGVEYFYGITPLQALGVWMFANAPPTLMWWLFSNRHQRSVGPLLLGFATAVAAGGLTLLLWLQLTASGAEWLSLAAVASGLPLRA